MARQEAWEPWVDGGLKLLWLAAWIELLCGRMLSRAGVFIPKHGLVLAAYRLLSDAGPIAFNLALLVALAVLGLGLWVLWARGLPGGGRGRTAAGRAAFLLLAGAVLLVLAPLAGGRGVPWSLAAALWMLLTVAVYALQALRRLALADRLGLALVLGAHLAWYGVAAAQLARAAGGTGTWAGATPLLRLGELLALLAPVTLALARLRLPAAPVHRQRVQRAVTTLVVAAALVALFAGAYLSNADMAGVLAIWSLGFTLGWPGWLYALALAAATWYLGHALSAGGAERQRGFGLGLIWIAGFGLQVNLQHLLVLAGYLLLTGLLAPRLPKPVRQEV